MSFGEIMQMSNVLVIPALGYIILLERRITRMQMQIENLLETLKARK